MNELQIDCRKRRKLFLEKIGDNSIAIIANSSDFHYLTGSEEQNAIAVFITSKTADEYIILCDEPDQEKILWHGNKNFKFDADKIFPISLANTHIPELLANKHHFYYELGLNRKLDAKVFDWLNSVRKKNRYGILAPDNILRVSNITSEMRLRKTHYEISLLRKSAEIAANAHKRAMQLCRPGLYEYHLEAELMHEYLKNGGKTPAFKPIIASGNNACALHYEQNDAKLKSGDLILIDSGVSYKHYSSDISRTISINGKFTSEQAAIYQAVLDTQIAIIKMIRPGVTWKKLQETSEKLIHNKLLELGMPDGNNFYPHSIGHWLGLDTHDVGTYLTSSGWRKLEPNMVLTIEPGIYIPKGTKSVDKKWWGIGVRIEDDVLVTKNGCEVLTMSVPKTIQ